MAKMVKSASPGSRLQEGKRLQADTTSNESAPLKILLVTGGSQISRNNGLQLILGMVLRCTGPVTAVKSCPMGL